MPDAPGAPDSGLKICGFEGVSLVDFPRRVASVIFLGGCNFRCPYCQNPDLVLRPGSLAAFDVADIVERIRQRSMLVDGVVVTGGEPLIHGTALRRLLETLRETGVAIKLDTNGYEIEELSATLRSGLVNYVAMDVKTSPARYQVAVGRVVDSSRVEKAIRMVQQSGVAHEFRTTCVPGLVGQEDLVAIARILGPDERYFLQQFRVSGDIIDPSLGGLTPYSVDRMRDFAARIASFVAEVGLRGC